jgi:putative Mg2+ transporter-C (MgtC) family protein
MEFEPELWIALKALGAGILGLAIGWQREEVGSAAGDRTFALVALGTAAMTAFGMYAFPENADRLISGAITGIGFLGAGILGFSRNRENLLTAASLWAVSALGILVGAGLYLAAGLLALLMWFILRWWEKLPVVGKIRSRGMNRQPGAEDTQASPADGNAVQYKSKPRARRG